MKKKRISRKFNNFWLDEDEMVHICNFLSCGRDCKCEDTRMSLDFLEEAVKKIKEVLRDYEKKEGLDEN